MPAQGEAVAVLIVGLAALLTVRLLIAVPGWISRTRKPETRAIRVVGVGGGGSNAVDRMVRAHIRAASFVVCNTDAQALRRSSAATKIRIGDAITGGLGSGGDPEIGRRAAEEDEAKIAHAVAGADLVFVTAGLGGGTGSGAAPIVAANARSQGALTIAVVTKPFGFEGSHRMRIAEAAAADLAANVDALIIVPNDRVADVLDEEASMIDAFGVVDDVLLQAVQGIIDLIATPGLINLDFADVRSVMQNAGPALIGLGRGTGHNRATDAARQAIASPLLEANIEGARGILFNVSGPADLRLREVREAAEAIRERADPEANVIFGASFNESLGQDVLITLIATGLTTQAQEPAKPRPFEAESTDGAPSVAESPAAIAPRRTPKRPARLVTAPAIALPAASPAGALPPASGPTADEVHAERVGAGEEMPADELPAAEVVPATEVVPVQTQHIQPRSAGGPEPTLDPHGPPRADGDDLDVPSFLRRGGRPASRT